MIKEVLQLLVTEGILDKNQIARRVGIQVETLDDMIRLLVERGYLKAESDGCDIEASCTGCHNAKGCDMITSTGLVYYVTERGKAYAGMNGGESG